MSGYCRKHSRKLGGIIFLSMTDWFGVCCAACACVHVFMCDYMFAHEKLVCPPSNHLCTSSPLSFTRLCFLLCIRPSLSLLFPIHSLHFITRTEDHDLVFALISASFPLRRFVLSPRSEDESDPTSAGGRTNSGFSLTLLVFLCPRPRWGFV